MKKNLSSGFGQRFQEVLRLLGLNQKTAANILDVSPSLITEIIKERTKPSNLLLTVLELKFGINKKWLLTGSGEPFLPQEKIQKISEEKTDYSPLPRVQYTPDGSLIIPKELLPHPISPAPPPPATHSIPVPLLTLPAAASFPGRIIPEQILETIQLPATFLPRGAQNMLLSLVQVTGNSMHPTIPDKSFVLLRHDHIDPSTLHRHIIAARIGTDEVTIKRLIITPTSFILQPDNPEHTSLTLPLHATDFIIAVAIRCWKKIPI